MAHIEIPITNAPGRVALIDAADLHLVQDITWNLRQRDRDPDYVVASHTRRLMHRVILGVTDPTLYVDHINRDGLDNRRSNLRLVTPAQSNANRGPLNGRRFKGTKCAPCQRGWTACIRINGVTRNLGTFPTEEAAAHAYDAAALEAWGEFAFLNFPSHRVA